MKEKKIAGPKTTTVIRQESSFDRACDSAYMKLFAEFGIDEYGHCDSIDGWERSCCNIKMDFVSYSRIGLSHIYTFKAVAIKVEDDEE